MGSPEKLPVPRPKSPPELYGKRRELAKILMLEREIGFLQDELKSIETLKPASSCIKEVVDYVVTAPEPLITVCRKTPKSCGFWKWLLCGDSCFNFSCACCCDCFNDCSIETPRCCSLPADCCSCSLPKCSCAFKRPSCPACLKPCFWCPKCDSSCCPDCSCRCNYCFSCWPTTKCSCWPTKCVCWPTKCTRPKCSGCGCFSLENNCCYSCYCCCC